MSTEKNPLIAMLEQYDNNNKPRFEKTEAKVYDLKNYFTTYIKDGIKSATKQIRILPTADGVSSPFVEQHVHKVLVEGEWKTFACLKHEKGEACPFCEAYDALRSTGNASDKELAKKYNARMMYVVKVIDRDNEADGVKFWRFAHDFRKEGILDKIQGVLKAIKKDITDTETGRDLVLTINRNQNNVPVVSAVASLDPSVLSEDAETKTAWLSDARTWEDVYSVRSYDYLKIIVTGGVPVWDAEKKTFVDKNAAGADDELSNLDSEITMGIETVKESIKVATEPTADVPATEPATTEVDDLPF